MRDLILANEPGPIDFYPVTLTQLSTKGLVHNLTPIMQTKNIPSFDGTPGWSVDIIRFYFDGLIAHIHKHASDAGKTAELGSMIIGGSEELAVTTVTYEASFQAENLRNIMASAIYPQDTARASGRSMPLEPAVPPQKNEADGE